MTPDGVRLNADIYRPQSGDRQPALLTLTPYTSAYAYGTASAYARAGFAVVVVDVRGRGGSGGAFDLYNDAADGAACVDWVARQDWCDGKVALFGGSYAGLNQWAIAARASEALKAIAPVAAPMPGFDADGVNGVFPLNNLRWTSFIRGRGVHQALFADEAFWRALFTRHTQAGDPIGALPDLLGSTDTTLSLIIDAFSDPQYWAARVPDRAALGRVAIPVLTVTGTADNAQRGALEYRRRHLEARPDARHFLVMGPWDHAGRRDPLRALTDPETVDSRTVESAEHDTLVGFYNWALRGAPLPALLQAGDRAEAVYIAGAEVWRRTPGASAARGETLHLKRDGAMATQPDDAPGSLAWPDCPPHDASASPEADPETPDLFALLGGERPQTDWIYRQDFGWFQTFWTPPLAQSRWIVGAPRLECALSADVDAIDMACLVFERSEDGASVILSSDMRRVGGLSRTPRRVVFDTFRFAARQLASASRVGLQFRILNSSSFQRVPASPSDRPHCLTLHLGGQHSAKLHLPFCCESENCHV